MKNNAYETAVIINAALDDEQIESIISRIKDTIISNGGEIKNVDNWGRKRLAYMVKKSKIGYYCFFRFFAPSNIISKLERFYQLDEQILRYLTIKLDSDALEYFDKNQPVSSKLEIDVPVTLEVEDIVPDEIANTPEISDK